MGIASGSIQALPTKPEQSAPCAPVCVHDGQEPVQVPAVLPPRLPWPHQYVYPTEASAIESTPSRVSEVTSKVGGGSLGGASGGGGAGASGLTTTGASGFTAASGGRGGGSLLSPSSPPLPRMASPMRPSPHP